MHFGNANGITLSQTTRLVSKPTKSNEPVSVVVLMSVRPDAEYLQEMVNGLPRKERSQLISEELHLLAKKSQGSLFGFLKSEYSRGKVKKFKSIPICNALKITADSEIILEISRRHDVSAIIADDNAESSIEYGDYELDDVSWQLDLINAREVWADGYMGEGILIAIIDTGVDYTNVNLENRLWDGGDEYPNHGYDFHNDDNDPMDDEGHGTGVAAILVGDGSEGDTTGVAPEATLMILKVRQDMVTGLVSSAWEAQQFALDQGADIIHMSLGWAEPDEGDRAIWRSNYNLLNAAGIVCVKSAGNNRMISVPPNAISVPGGVPSPWRHPDEIEEGGLSGLITVGATGADDTVSTVSSPGPVTWIDVEPWFDYTYDDDHAGLIKPDLTAPSTGFTSYAAPVVSGIAALMLSKALELLPAEIDELLETTALDLGVEGKDNDYGAGRVQADEAVDAIYLPMGSVSGTAIDANTDEPLEGLVVYVLERRRCRDTTNVDGEYEFQLPVGQNPILAKLLASPVYEAGNVTIEEDQNVELNFEYPSGIFSMTPESLWVRLNDDNPDETFDLTFRNSGTLEYDLSLEIKPDIEDTVEYIDLLSSIIVSDNLGDNRFHGLTWDKGIFYISGSTNQGEANVIYKFSEDDEYLGSILQPGHQDSLPGMTDLAFDGSNIWGIDGSSIYSITPDSGNIIDELESPYHGIVSIAWDEDRENLWIASGDNDILAIDPMDGSVSDTILNNLTIAGLGYYQDDEDGYPLFLAIEDSVRHRSLFKVDPETGQNLQVSEELNTSLGGTLRGLSVVDGYNKYFQVVVSIAYRIDYVIVAIWKLDAVLWGVTLERNSLTIEPDGVENVVLNLNSSGLPDDYYRGFVYTSYTAGAGETIMPVTMRVDFADVPLSEIVENPSNYSISNVYPNPFNSTAIIRYSLPERADIKLKIYDILGREVETIRRGLHLPGSYEIQYGSTIISSGVYFLTIESNNNINAVRKIVILK
ncbi:MAG: S8 family serine peptidase [Candidatus Electryonea clarkiae]|nr:S8 family serine peptidase [Candidatus Electryonea clarkiae]MDP8288371.1 S8 family serine peptidase [Candidatus Electryonea clarkiae]